MKLTKLQFGLLIVLFNFLSASAFAVTAKFSYSKSNNCSPAIVVFTNESTTGSGITYTWDFDTGSTVTATDNSSKTQLYSKPGTYTVTLTVHDGTTTYTTSTKIVIAQGPQAAFTANTTEGCTPLLVTYTSTSTAGDAAITKTSWDFRNGEFSAVSPASYTYSNAGKYSIVLKVTDSNGCFSTVESDSIITVVKKPIANFSASDTFACSAPLKLSFKNLSSGSTDLSYYWDFGNKTTSTEVSKSVVYDSVGNYDVKLKVTDTYGCVDSIIKKSYINIGYATDTITVLDSHRNVVNSKNLCSGTYTFKLSSTSYPDYTWTINDNNKIISLQGSDSIVYAVKDTGTLLVSLAYGKSSVCTNTVSKSFKKSAIKASFVLDTAPFCSFPKVISIQNNSENATTYAWYLSGRLFSSSSTPVLTINKSDIPTKTYEQLYSHNADTISLPVKLIINNAEGCSDTILKNANLSMPVARFMSNKVSGCLPLSVSFSDSSKSAYTIDKYSYKINNKLIGSSENVDYIFTSPGIYEVTEIIQSGECYDTSQVVKIRVGDKLKPDFTVTPTEVCNGGQIHIVGNTNNNSAVNTWYVRSPSIFYLSSTAKPDTSITINSDILGAKDISLSVDYNGCMSDTTKQAIYTVKGLAGNFSESFSCDSALVYKFKSSIKPSTSLAWTIDTAHYANLDSVNYKFAKSGDYTVTLVANAPGCSLTRSKIIKVRQIAANFTVNDSVFCVNDSVLLASNTSVDYVNSCYNEGFLWNYGDASAPHRTYKTSDFHIYKKKGLYTILLVATADNGCVDSTSTKINVYKPEDKISADTTSGCVPSLTVQFTNASTDSTIIKSVWNFGDNTSDSTNNALVTHNFTSPTQKTYNATLTVTDAYQCYSNYTLPITLNGFNADFQADDNAICLGQTVTFALVDSKFKALYWYFGDGDSSNVAQHTYTKYGDFDVSVIVSNNGCIDTLTKSKYISVEKANADFTVSDSTLSCYPDTVYYIHTSLNGSAAVNRTWKFDSNESSINSDSIYYIYTKPGTYHTQLTVTTLNGCKASSTKTIVVAGPTGTFSFSPQKICYNDSVRFKVDSLVNVDSWKLNFGDGNTSSNSPVYHHYTTRGSLVPFITLTSANCNVTKTVDTLYVSTTQANFKSASDSICYGSTFNINNTSTNSNYWVWKINDITKSIDFNLSDVSLTNIGNYNIKLIATGIDNCVDTLVKKYTVVAVPKFSISGDSVICKGSSSTALTVNEQTGWSISWLPINSSAFTINVSPTAKTVYTATVTNANGCSSSVTKTVTVNEPSNYTRQPVGDTTINAGSTIPLLILVDSSKVNYVWSPNYKISCLTCNNPKVSPLITTAYTVEVTNGCFDFSETFNVKVITDYYLEAPTAFSPNGDSNNDVFKFEYKNIDQFELKIYNRWGKLVYSTHDVNTGWDGTLNGSLQNIDSYSYIVNAKTTAGIKIEKRGSFLLLK